MRRAFHDIFHGTSCGADNRRDIIQCACRLLLDRAEYKLRRFKIDRSLTAYKQEAVHYYAIGISAGYEIRVTVGMNYFFHEKQNIILQNTTFTKVRITSPPALLLFAGLLIQFFTCILSVQATVQQDIFAIDVGTGI